MQENTRKRVIPLILFLGSTLFALGLGEIVLRTIKPLQERSLYSSSFLHRVPHPTLGWVLQPNVHYKYLAEAGPMNVTYNSEGWRDRDHKNDKAGRRAIILGDSFMEGYTVDDRETLARQLESILSSQGSPIDIYNLGVGGYGTLQQSLALSEVGSTIKPDLILLGFFLGNDIKNNSLELDGKIADPLKAKARPFLDFNALPDWKVTAIDYAGAKERYNAAVAKRKRDNSSFAIVRLWRSLRIKPVKEFEAPEGLDAELDAAGAWFCEEPAEYARGWKITAHVFQKLRAQAQSMGARLVVFTVPSLQETDDEDRSRFVAKQKTKLCMNEPPAYKKLSTILKGLDIEYLDLRKSFLKEHRSGSLFDKGDRHWNQAGHLLAAQELARFLNQD